TPQSELLKLQNTNDLSDARTHLPSAWATELGTMGIHPDLGQNEGISGMAVSAINTVVGVVISVVGHLWAILFWAVSLGVSQGWIYRAAYVGDFLVAWIGSLLVGSGAKAASIVP